MTSRGGEDGLARIFHLTTRAEWEQARRDGACRPPSLSTEGFVHCSEVDQVLGAANRFFHERTDVLLLEIDPSRLTAELLYEPAVDVPQLFPHVHGPVDVEAVVAVHEMSTDPDGGFRALPAGLEPS